MKTSLIWERKLSPKSRKHKESHPRRTIPRYTVIKWTNMKNKEKILKSNKGKATENILGNPHKTKQILQQKLCRPEGTGIIYFKWWKEKKTKQNKTNKPTTRNIIPSKALVQIWWRNQKLHKQAKVPRIQHHWTSFTTNAKEISLGRKEKVTTRNKRLIKWESSPVKANIQ